ncbi:glycosyltransferase [Pedobacter immunditicola]|uniref:glycosyltransferase n=1 Tax=Pedobacter immunditicola TaxID=3133440 RepID=UPI003095F575
MKILHYINGLSTGGAEKLLTDILPLMKQSGHEVHLLLSNNNTEVKKYYDLIQEGGVPIKRLNKANFNPFQVIHLIRILRKEQFDIVHAHLFPSQYWLAIASWFKPPQTRLVKSEHNIFNNRRKYKILKLIERLVYSRYAMVISITEAVDANLLSWLRNVRTVVIHNGVNLKQIAAERVLGMQVNYEFLKPGHFNILMVGRFSGAKDQNTLIQAMQYLPAHFHLFLAGRGPLVEVTKQFTESLGLRERVHFLGMRMDVYSLMNKVDLNVLSTHFEGLSGVALESLASGKPFIGSDVPGVNNIVPDPRFLFPNKQPELLAKKIIAISADPELSHEMVKTAQAYVARYDIPLMCEKYLEVYQSVLNDG